MLINLHNPKLVQIVTHEAAPEHGEFYTVQLSELRADSAGAVLNLFISDDWSQWDAIVAQVTEYRNTAEMTRAGTYAGTAAGSWVIDGNTTTETARNILQGIEDGDPQVMDMQPAPLSGEWADNPVVDEVLALVGMDYDNDAADDMLAIYETAFGTAYWAEVQRAAHGIVTARLEYLRAEIQAERISYGEIVELQYLAAHIGADDVELREWAGIPEHSDA